MTKGYYVKSFIKTNIVLVIATGLAIISCFFVFPDKEYLGYFDTRTLVSLFGMSAVVASLKNLKFFRILAGKILKVFRTTKSATTALVAITYFASMLIANDMALITFLPLGYFVLKSAGREDRMAFTFTMQTIAANLGGMLTPFGNPQNLYIYNAFEVPTLEFFKIMLLPTLVAIVLIALCCLIGKSEKIELIDDEKAVLNKPKTAVCFVLFAYMVVLVFRLVPTWTGLLIIPVMLLFDHKALLKVDYPLLLTFCMFFVFTGNLSRIQAVNDFFSALLQKSVLLTGVLSCQVISNVPSAVLLSKFTTNYQSLLVAVNIGGCGTLISSMASLITFKTFSLHRPKERKKYILLNSLLSFGFLIVLTAFCLIIN